MSKRKRVFSGAFVITILVRKFDFAVVSQRGSHVKLRSVRHEWTTIVPLHKELAQGTLDGVLHLAGLNRRAFLKAIEE